MINRFATSQVSWCDLFYEFVETTLQGKLDPEELFTKQERIGKGSFGEVYKGIDRRTQKTIAIKIINLEEAEDEIEDIQQEITVLSQCDSCFITKYIGSYIKASHLLVMNSNLVYKSSRDNLCTTWRVTVTHRISDGNSVAPGQIFNSQ